MKINDGKTPINPALEGPAVHSGRRVTPASGVAADDRVSVSEAARELARLRAEVGPIDVVRAERVGSLRATVSAGRYQPDVGAVAGSVLRELVAQLLA